MALSERMPPPRSLISQNKKTVVDLVCVQQAQAPAATRNPDCVQNSLNVPSLSPDLQNGKLSAEWLSDDNWH